MESWLGVLVLALIANTAIRWALWQETRAIERKTREIERTAHQALAVLVVWADTWGDDPVTVRAKLAEALKR